MLAQYQNGWLNTHGGAYNPLLDLMINAGGVEVGDPQGNYPALGMTRDGLQMGAAYGAMRDEQQRESALQHALRRIGGPQRMGILDRYYMHTGEYDRIGR